MYTMYTLQTLLHAFLIKVNANQHHACNTIADVKITTWITQYQLTQGKSYGSHNSCSSVDSK